MKTKKTTKVTSTYDAKTRQLTCRDEWDLASLPDLQQFLEAIDWPTSGNITFDGKDITKMDSAGAWLLLSWEDKLTKENLTVKLVNFPKQYETLISIVQNEIKHEGKLKRPKKLSSVAELGKNTIQQYQEFILYLSFIGRLTIEALGILVHTSRWRWNSLTMAIYRNGYQALPIIALLSFMIGVVLTYQMGLQLRNYGANIYIVDLLGASVLREFGPLLTAIMVAGRTGSAYTAQLGIMKINQEIDALDTMGVTPGELLLLPRILGLVIALPLLTIWSDIFGVVGGMVMSNNMLNITWYDFLYRFGNVIPLRSLLIGLGKAPVFALIIASIGCFQGIQVKENADSVGLNTTKSVVLSIFFIIVADAIFSVIFSKLKL